MIKIIKKIVPLICFVSTSLFTGPMPEYSPIASSAASWNFEIYNKSDTPIWVSVGYIKKITDPFHNSVLNEHGLMGRRFEKSEEVKGQKVRAIIDFTLLPVITIWNKVPKIGVKPVLQKGLVACRELQAGETCTKQAFLTYDNNGLRPQTGRFLGLPQMFGQPGTTDSGLRITNNINQLQIQDVR